MAYRENNRTEEAIAALRAALDHLYRLPERMGFQARADYYSLTEQPDQQRAVIEMWVALHPESPAALERYSLLLLVRGDWEGLIQTIKTRYRLSPANHSLLKELAEAHENVGDDEQALAALEQYAERIPADYSGHVDLARIHRRLGAYDQAREHLQRAIIVDPLNPEPVGELASLDLAAGRFDAALAGYERAAELARTSRQRAGVLSQLKDYHRFRGQMEAAIRAAEAWLAEVSGVFSPREIAQRRLDDIGIYLVGSRQRVRTCSARPWLQTWDGSRRRTASTRWPSPTTGMRWLRMIGPLTCIAGSQPRRARRGAWTRPRRDWRRRYASCRRIRTRTSKWPACSKRAATAQVPWSTLGARCWRGKSFEPAREARAMLAELNGSARLV